VTFNGQAPGTGAARMWVVGGWKVAAGKCKKARKKFSFHFMPCNAASARDNIVELKK